MENKLPIGKQGEVMDDFARIIKLSEVRPHPKKRILLPRFRTVVNLLKNNKEVFEFFQNQKKSKLNKEEKQLIEERIKYAKIYIDNYEIKENISVDKPFIPNDSQNKFIVQLINQLDILKNQENKELIQQVVFDSIKQTNINSKEAFTAIYQTLTGKAFGPKIGDLIINLGVKETLSLLKKNNKERTLFSTKKQFIFPDFKDKKIFSIDNAIAQKYPSINIGIAVIKNINIKKTDSDLVSEINQFVQSQSHLSNEVISSYPEVITYRKLYKEMEVDWHSRRPSPEALLRRISQKKDLYQINTCVDAYNLVVMKNRVSVGAFDYNKFSFPTIMRFPKEGEEIFLLGDKEPTKFKPSELAYFDQLGGYNIDFNYRDAQRTAVTENTKDILLNIDGIYDITRE
ncbi:MAG: phenylalanine--tRNA ligase beta subunit-related protein, partial [Candidatus Roizmanbacteria bacterium]|nr:phenylalanine--tRNA ligase beta subunit-related protein [Candidatus Roizmanbacteria bacterium]